MSEQRKPANPLSAIRAYCLECVCGSYAEVKQCSITLCPLYPFRFGKNPYRKPKTLTDDQIKLHIRILEEYRERQSTDKEGKSY